MKKIVHNIGLKTIVAAFLTLIITLVVLLVLAFVVPKSRLDKYFNKIVKLEKETTIGSDLPNTKRFEVEANGKFIVFYTEGTHDYGSLALWVIIRPDGKVDTVLESIQEVNKNMSFMNQTAIYIQTALQNVDPNKLKDVLSSVSGSTTSVSNGKAREMFVLVVSYHFDLGSPYEDAYGQGVVVDQDFSFEKVISGNTEIVSKSLVKNEAEEVLGYSYRLKGLGIFNSEDSTERPVVFDLMFDNSGIIVGFQAVLSDMVEDGEDYYAHTPGFIPRVESFVAKLVGKTLAEAILVSTASAGATNSCNVVMSAIILLEETLR